MLTVWGRANSSNVMKVVWLADEMALPFRRIDTGGAFGGTDTPEFLAMNPNAQVPTIQDGAVTLWESNAILRYLAATHPGGTAFYPHEPAARAPVEQWLDWQQTTVGGPTGTVFSGLIRTPPEKRDGAAIAAAVKAAGAAWSILDRVLAKHDFVAGHGLTLADIALGVHVHRWLNLPIERPEQPALRAWYERLLSRPAYVTHAAQKLA